MSFVPAWMILRRHNGPAVDPGPLVPRDGVIGFLLGVAAAATFALGFWLGAQ